VDGSGQQLVTVPVGGADTVSITFSEDVNVIASHLKLVGLTSANVPSLAEFSYDVFSMTATWRFEGWTFGDNYLISLSDAVTDVEGDRLDGEWTNPTSVTTTNAAVSVFPSGDDEAGGNFNFIATLLPGDVNLDQHVNEQDFAILACFMDVATMLFIEGDMDGNGTVDGHDENLMLANWGVQLDTVWMLADLDGDSDVDAFDVNTLVLNISMSSPTLADGDLNGDGFINGLDLDLIFEQFGLQLELVS
jgi:hypothetical protein